MGGLVALALGGREDPGPIRAVLAADPPLTTAKLWNVAANFRRAMAQKPDDQFLVSFASEVFGITATDLEERIYYPFLGALRVPALIVTGDIPLLPPRPLNRVACLFDEVDRFVVEKLYPGKAQVHQCTDAGHLILAEARSECLALIKAMLAEHVALDGIEALSQ